MQLALGVYFLSWLPPVPVSSSIGWGTAHTALAHTIPPSPPPPHTHTQPRNGLNSTIWCVGINKGRKDINLILDQALHGDLA